MKDLPHWSKNSNSLVIPLITSYISRTCAMTYTRTLNFKKQQCKNLSSPPLFAAVQKIIPCEVVRQWNMLSREFLDASSLQVFKARLDRIWNNLV